jgi:hypothetical protein
MARVPRSEFVEIKLHAFALNRKRLKQADLHDPGLSTRRLCWASSIGENIGAREGEATAARKRRSGAVGSLYRHLGHPWPSSDAFRRW